MLFAFLLFGSFWFWAAIAIPAVLLIAFVENEKGVSAFFTMVATVAVFVAFGDKHWLGGVLPWIMHNPLHLLAYVAGYVLAGIAWGFAKWFLYLLRKRDEYEAVRRQFDAGKDEFVARQTARRLADARNSVKGGAWGGNKQEAIDAAEAAEKAKIDAEPKVTGFDKDLFQAYCRDEGIHLGEVRPLAIKNKGRIVFWMSYWPWSGIWTLINDPITRIYRFIWHRLGATFENMSKAMFAKYQDEI